jgi:glycosyltransferase involved in cell wall biosynthesis
VKIALLTPRYTPNPGGLERHVEELARAVARRGGHVDVLTQDTGRVLPRTAELNGVTVRRFQSAVHGLPFHLAPELWDFVRRAASSYDIVHAHSDCGPLAIVAARARTHRLLLTSHCSFERLLHGTYGRATRAALMQTCGVLCASRVEAEELARALPGISGNVVVIPNGVDVVAIRAAAPYSIPRTVVLVVGRLERFKRVDRGISALAGLDASFEMVVVGHGPAQHSLAAFARDLKVDDRVHFLGPLADAELYRWLRTASLVLALSCRESFGCTVLEAIAAGTPVVASDIAAHREAASHVGRLGVTLVPVEASPLTLADAIMHAAALRLPNPPELSIAPSDRLADATVTLYEALIAGRQIASAAADLQLEPASAWTPTGELQPAPSSI